MSNAAYNLGRLVKLLEVSAPKQLNVFENTATAGTLSRTLALIMAQWAAKALKQLVGDKRRELNEEIEELVAPISSEALAQHWDDDQRGQYALGYLQGSSTEGELTVTEAAEIAGIKRQNILARIKAGTLAARKNRSGHYMIRRADLEAWKPGKRGPKES